MGNPKEAAASDAPRDDPPPPYTEAAPPGPSAPPAPASAASRAPALAPLVTECAATPYMPLPQSLTAYYQAWKLTRMFHIGDSSNHKMFAVSTHAGVSGKGPDRVAIAVYNGSSDKSPILVVGGEPHKHSDVSRNLDSIINLAPLPGQDGFKVATEPMAGRLMPDGQTVAFNFSTEISSEPSGKGKQADTVHTLHREEFEWRMTPKKEVEDKEYMNEAKLFRLHTPNAGEGSASDGANVVAVASWKRLTSISKPFKLHFIHGGGDGGLDDRWRIVAVITALRVWLLQVTNFNSLSNIATAKP
ncbi:hypothetical protein FDECE_17213 [Fusarium decemcellulare]|nr:hypothetical protein FDECE_17213 [Fusarium decemcellulare]